MNERNSFWDRVWKNKAGQQTVIQMPNMTLWIWIVLMALRYIGPGGEFAQVITGAGYLVLFAWAWMELTLGQSYFRQGLGFIVALMTVKSLYML